MPREVLRSTVEIIMHFKSTTSFTNHGNAPFADCGMTRLTFEASTDRQLWTKHKHCHVDLLSEPIENPASSAYHLIEDARAESDNLSLFIEYVPQATFRSTMLRAAFGGGDSNDTHGSFVCQAHRGGEPLPLRGY